jgi:tetratricopeptide (TPR) repeat protein
MQSSGIRSLYYFSVPLILFCLTSPMWTGTGVNAGGAQATETSPDLSGWGRRAAGAGDYQIVVELSGRNEVSKYFGLSGSGANLRSICDMKTEAQSVAIEVFEGQRAYLATRKRDRKTSADSLTAHYSLGQIHSYRGDMVKAIKHLEVAYQLANGRELGTKGQSTRLELEELLGVAHLRRGELENCVHSRNVDRCIFPITAAGRHEKPSGAATAIEYFTKYLLKNPDNLEVRWLLNVAYMTIGQYPNQVPKPYLIPPAAFESKEQIGRFVDIAPSLGLDGAGISGGAIVDDFDNDGLLDVVVSSVDSCEPLHYYHNNGDGSFSDRTVQAKLSEQLGGINCTQTDYNNDGWLDIFVMRGGWEFPMRNSLLRNNGDGTFSDVTSESGLASAAYRTHSTAWADFDNDGWIDLYLGHEEAPSQLFRNQGDGTFADVSRRSGIDKTAFTKGASWGDYDNDGLPDLYVSNYAGENFLFHNNRNGTFVEVAKQLGVEKPIMSFPTWFWDYDNDGWLDIFVANYVPSVTETARWYLRLPAQAETLKLYRNTGRGSFEDVTAKVRLDRVVPSMGANFGDLDNDGFLDVYLGTGAPSYAALIPNIMFRNHDGNYFVDVTSSTGTGHLQKGHGIAFGDIDNDGDQDVFLNVGGYVLGDSYNRVLFANPGQGNNWISIKLIGVKTNRAAIGAKIRLTIGGGGAPLRYREVTSGGSFGASTLTQSIGLGKATRIDKLEIWWPASGSWQTFRDVAVNQWIEIRESEANYTKRALPSFWTAPTKRHASHR